MIIGHLPAGYILSRSLSNIASACGVSARLFIIAGVLGAMAPDLDMLYFHLIDQRQHHHHSYWSHFPLVWGAILLFSLLFLSVAKDKRRPLLVSIFALNGFVHLLLDSLVGDVWWLAPFVNQPFALFTVPTHYSPWWLNFVLHWSFLVELALVVTAGYLLATDVKLRRAAVPGTGSTH